MSSKKYRPYLTLSEITYLIECIQSRKDHISLDLLRYLQKYVSDIQAGLRIPNHTLQPTISQKLGFEESHASACSGIREIPTLLSLFTINGGSYIGLSIPEIQALKEYRFENSMMTEDEEAFYVQSLLTNAPKYPETF